MLRNSEAAHSGLDTAAQKRVEQLQNVVRQIQAATKSIQFNAAEVTGMYAISRNG